MSSMDLIMAWGGWAEDPAEFYLPLWHLGMLMVCLLVYAWLGGRAIGLDILQLRGDADDRRWLREAAGRCWLVGAAWFFLAVTILSAAFPVGLGILLPPVGWAITVMLLGVLLRIGCALGARSSQGAAADTGKAYCLAGAGVLIALGQGYILGVVMAGYHLAVPYRILAAVIALAVLATSLALGAVRVVSLPVSMALRRFTARLARSCSWLVAMGVAAGSVTVPLTNMTVLHRWLAPATLVYVAVLPIALLVCFAALEFTLRRLDDGHVRSRAPSVLFGIIVAGIFVGVGYSLFPFFIPGRLTIWEAAASVEALRWLMPGMAVTTLSLAVATLLAARGARRSEARAVGAAITGHP